MNEVFKTKSGLYARQDENLGLLVFSVYTGLIFAIQDSDTQKIISYLNKKKINLEPIYKKTLGPGWNINIRDAEYPSHHLLPCKDVFNIPRPSFPIMINWLLTGKCTNDCCYCYAQDLMHGICPEPSATDIKKIAKIILSYNPLVVVLTGGDPLVSEHLELAIEQLQGKTGLVIDTSGYKMNKNLAKKLKTSGAFVRISMDAEIPQINDKLRISCDKGISTSSIAIDAINTLLDEGVPVGVQTVATKKNRSDLEALGHKLYRWGIRSWRILMVAKSSTNTNTYKELVGGDEGLARYKDYIQKEIIAKHTNYWNNGMGIQITRNDVPNSVILVSPDGRFLTEASVNPQKELIDDGNPFKPRLNKMFEKINIHAHVKRYLNY